MSSQKELRQRIGDINTIKSDAKKTWYSKEEQTQTWLGRNMHKIVPYAMMLSLICFILISSPMTIEMISNITPHFAFLAPVGFELSVVIIAMAKVAGWESTGSGYVLAFAVILNIIINILVGIENMIQGHEQTGFVVIAILFAIFMSFYNKVVAEAVILWQTGQLEFRNTTIDKKWDDEKYHVFYDAVFSLALNHGATPKQAHKFADSLVADEFTPNQHPKPTSIVISEPLAPTMGFSAKIPVNSTGNTGKSEILETKKLNLGGKTKLEAVKFQILENSSLETMSRKEIVAHFEELGFRKSTVYQAINEAKNESNI